MNVLFVCEDNSALGIMAESILRAEAPARFIAMSGARAPAPSVNPYVLELLAAHRLPVAGLRPKAVAEFRAAGMPHVDFLITLSESAEACCTAWPANPVVAHWEIDGDESASEEEAIRDAFWTLRRRIATFAALPHGRLSRRVLERRMLTLQAGYL